MTKKNKPGRPKTLLDYDVKKLNTTMRQKCKNDGRVMSYILRNEIGVTIDTRRTYCRDQKIDPIVLDNCFIFLGEKYHVN